MTIAIKVIGIICLITAALTASVLLVFSQPVFALLGFHPIAAEFMTGDIDPGVMMIFRWDDLVFTSNEISHFHDVKALLGLLRLLCVLAIVISLVLFAVKRDAFRSASLWAPLVFVVIGATVVAAFFAFGFERVGVFFHQIIFPGGNWRFPFDSLMIRLYGTDVMVTGAGFVIATATIFLIILALVARFVPFGRRSKDGSED